MTDVNRLSKFKIGHTKNERGEKVANAYDLMRALRVPRSDANNCTKTLRGLTETHGLSFGSDLFKASEAKTACWAPSCTLPQMVEFIMVLPGDVAASVRKAAAIVFSSWLGAPDKVIRGIRLQHKIKDPLTALEAMVDQRLRGPHGLPIKPHY